MCRSSQTTPPSSLSRYDLQSGCKNEVAGRHQKKWSPMIMVACHFIFKQDEPSDYSIEDLVKEKNQTAEWDGAQPALSCMALMAGGRPYTRSCVKLALTPDVACVTQVCEITRRVTSCRRCARAIR